MPLDTSGEFTGPRHVYQEYDIEPVNGTWYAPHWGAARDTTACVASLAFPSRWAQGATVASRISNGENLMIDRDTTLIELLQDAWAFENRLLQLVQSQVSSGKDRNARRLFRDHARLTERQLQRIGRRMEALNVTPEGEGGWFSHRLARLAADLAVMDVWRDESTQGLINSYGIKQVECGMYRALLNLAQATDDEATATLARTSLEEEEATARRLLFCIGLATRSKAAA